jgi:hypothetical protein
MNNLIIFTVLTLFCMSCEKDDFNIENPNVEKFVQQIKNGTYDKYELNENGEKLWTKMPNFKKEHIPLLIEHALDTTKITPWEHFPLNPINSIPPYRIVEGKSYIMLGEYFLWCVEGIIEGNTFASLTPILKNQNYREDERLNGKEILEVGKLYQDWWKENSRIVGTNKLPLEGTAYRWK